MSINYLHYGDQSEDFFALHPLRASNALFQCLDRVGIDKNPRTESWLPTLLITIRPDSLSIVETELARSIFFNWSNSPCTSIILNSVSGSIELIWPVSLAKEDDELEESELDVIEERFGGLAGRVPGLRGFLGRNPHNAFLGSMSDSDRQLEVESCFKMAPIEYSAISKNIPTKSVSQGR